MRQAGSGAGKAPEGGREGGRARAQRQLPGAGRLPGASSSLVPPQGRRRRGWAPWGWGARGGGRRALCPLTARLWPAGEGKGPCVPKSCAAGCCCLGSVSLALSLRVSVFIFVVVTSLKTLNPLLTGNAWQGQPRLMLTQQTLPQDSPPIDR